MHSYLLLIFILLMSNTYAQKMDTIYLEQLLQRHPDLFQQILNHPTKHEVQILYTQIDRDQSNIPHFKSYSYRLNPHWYFYPANFLQRF